MENITPAAALAYARLGWPVLPLKPGSKEPLTPNGVKDASTDDQRIAAWWLKYPDANVGIATGAPGPDVLDIDNPDHPEAPVLGDACVLSGRGVHYYFDGSDGGTIKLPYGELRRRGSYVVAPPSVHPSGERYRWNKDPLFRRPVPDEIIGDHQSAGAGPAPEVATVPPGGMYDHLVDRAVRLVRAGITSVEAIERGLLAEFDAVREPGVEYAGDASETLRIAEWAAKSRIAENERADELVLAPPLGGRAHTPASEAAYKPLIFRTPAEIRRDLPPEPSWLWRGVIAEGLITIVGGAPKVGKSTMVYAALDRMVRGEHEFLGSELTATDIVVLSEEHAITALAKLSDSPRLHVVTRDFAWPMREWEHALRDGITAAKRCGSKLLVVDSFTFWARLEADASKDSGAVQARLQPLIQASHEGIGVLLVHHDRKGGGEHGEGLHGSITFAANADVIVEVERLPEGTPRNLRRLSRLSRWPLSPFLLTRWTEDAGYELLREVDSASEATDYGWAERIREVLAEHGTTRSTQLELLLNADSRQWYRGAQLLVDDGEATRTGFGGMKDPITYSLNGPATGPAI